MTSLYGNEHKSTIYCGGIPPVVQQAILDHMGCAYGSFPFIYLRLPLSTKGLTHRIYKPLIDKIKQKICSLTTRKLSYPSRKVLIQPVLSRIITF